MHYILGRNVLRRMRLITMTVYQFIHHNDLNIVLAIIEYSMMILVWFLRV